MNVNYAFGYKYNFVSEIMRSDNAVRNAHCRRVISDIWTFRFETKTIINNPIKRVPSRGFLTASLSRAISPINIPSVYLFDTSNRYAFASAATETCLYLTGLNENVYNRNFPRRSSNRFRYNSLALDFTRKKTNVSKIDIWITIVT